MAEHHSFMIGPAGGSAKGRMAEPFGKLRTKPEGAGGTRGGGFSTAD